MKKIFTYSLTLLMLSSFVANIQATPLSFVTLTGKRFVLDLDLDNTTVGQTKAMIAKEMNVAPERLRIIMAGKVLSNDTLWAPLKPQQYAVIHVIIKEEEPKNLGEQVADSYVYDAKGNPDRNFKEGDKIVLKRKGQNELAKVLPASSVDPDIRELVINGILVPVQVGPNADDIRTVSQDEIVGKL